MFERTKLQQAPDAVGTQEDNHTSVLRSLKRGLVSTALFIGGATAIGVWDSTAPPSYIPWFTQTESFLRHVLPLAVTNQLALTDGSQVYQATIMAGSALIAYISLRDPKPSKLKTTVTRNISTLLMWLPNMILADGISASLRTNDNAHTIALIAPDPVRTGAWRNGVTQNSTWMHPIMVWGDSSSPIMSHLPNFYELGLAAAGAYLFARFVGFKLYDKYQANKLLRQTAQAGTE